MINKNLFVAIGTLVCLSFSSCQDCDDCTSKKIDPSCSESTTRFLQSDLLERFFFESGSFWIYKSHTGVLDTFKVISSIRQVGKNPDVSKEICLQAANNIIKTSTRGNWSVNSETSLSGFADVIYSNDNGSSVYRFSYTDSICDAFNGENGQISILDSFIVNSDTFKNVLRLVYPAQINRNEYLRTAYFVKGVGMVKYTDWDGNVWDLESFSIK
ncbi:MAG: hypothetical protein GC181_07535 [Bacteroidetes bacterium]|nr:hypothetical protein [Bacteroidota bacterium]